MHAVRAPLCPEFFQRVLHPLQQNGLCFVSLPPSPAHSHVHGSGCTNADTVFYLHFMTSLSRRHRSAGPRLTPFQMLSKNMKQAGFFSLYRGLPSPLLGSMVENSVLFSSYGTLLKHARHSFDPYGCCQSLPHPPCYALHSGSLLPSASSRRHEPLCHVQLLRGASSAKTLKISPLSKSSCAACFPACVWQRCHSLPSPFAIALPPTGH